MMMADTMNDLTCFHCGANLTGASDLQVVVDGTRRPVCGPDCHATTQTILKKGLGDFYRFRDAPTAAGNAADTNRERWTSYDRPALQKEFVSVAEDGTRTAHLLVNGVRCAACAWLIERVVATISGVKGLSVNPVTTRTDISFDPNKVNLSELLSQIARLGYTPCPHTEDEAERIATEERHRTLRRLIVAGLGMMQVTSYAVALYMGAFQTMDPGIEQFLRLISLLVATPVVLYSGSPFFAGAWRDMKTRSPGMDVPVALAIGGAYAASVWNSLTGQGEVYFDSATMFVFFLSVARYLELAGRHRVLGLTDAFARHIPRVATRIVDGRYREVGVMELVPGDLVLVRPGQAFPADGILEAGIVHVDESLLTGESRPVLKQAGDRIVAGGINQRSAATLRIDRVGANTALAQISHLMTAAQREKPRLVQLADRVASRFVTGVLFAAAVVGAAWWAVEPDRAFAVVLAVLVVTCPCALALATPAAFTVASGALARRGFLLRRAGAIEELDRVTDVLFDKTGTLTDRNIMLRRVETYGWVTEDRALGIAAALEAHSEHPLASAFKNHKIADGVSNVTAYPGEGLEGLIHGRRYRIGTGGFIAALTSSADPNRMVANPATQNVFLGDENGVVARFEIAESVRVGAVDAVATLAGRGIRSMIASGDRPQPVRMLAEQLGIDTYRAELRPADKLSLVRDLQAQGKTIAMVGDGINDSPVLAGANVSVAMGSGTSLAQHSADCVLLSENLTTLIDAFDVARRTMVVVRQNLAWALCYNLVALPLAATGVLTPWMAALGMSASSLIVTMNALRLSRSPTITVKSQGMAKPCCGASSVEPV